MRIRYLAMDSDAADPAIDPAAADEVEPKRQPVRGDTRHPPPLIATGLLLLDPELDLRGRESSSGDASE